MMEMCGDNRFEIIDKAKKDLLEGTNIDTSEDEMKVLNNFLFRCWQMGWLDKYDEQADKYRWHDLRVDKDDLPKLEEEVDVACIRTRVMANGKEEIPIRTHAMYENGTLNEDDSVWCWSELYNADYDKKNDCYFIPEGWYEWRHYGELDYGCAVDDKVVAWRYIEPFEGGDMK